MPNVRRLLARAMVWFHIRMWLGAAIVSLTLAAGAMVLLRISERLLGFPVQWNLAWLIAVSAGLVGSLIWVFLKRASRVDVARVLDERASLREALSTALCVEHAQDAWSRAAVSQAEQAAGGVRITRALPMKASRLWGAPLVLGALFLLAGLAPQFDLLRLVQRAQATEEDRQAIADAEAQAAAARDAIREALSHVDDPDLKDMSDQAAEPETMQPRTPQEVRLEAIRKLTTVQDRLSDLRQGEKAQALEELKKKMNELRQPRGAELSDLARALQRGDFQEARRQLDELKQKLTDGDMTEEQKAAIQEQLKSLAEQLEKLAQDHKALENKLREAGLDPALASDPEALRKALEKLDSLTPAQKQALQQAAEASAQACSACKGMASAMNGAAAGLASGDSGAFGALDGQLSAAEMMSMDLAALEAASQAIKKNLASLGQKLGQCSGDEGGMRAGTGAGPDLGDKEAESLPVTSASKVKVKGQTSPGPIIGTTLVQGDQIRGESARQFADAVRAGEASAAEAIDSKRVPKELEDAVKRYFGRLEDQIPESSEAAPQTEPDTQEKSGDDETEKPAKSEPTTDQ